MLNFYIYKNLQKFSKNAGLFGFQQKLTYIRTAFFVFYCEIITYNIEENMKPNLNELLKQVQKMQADLDKFNTEFGERTFEFDTGAGAVNVTINGKKEILALNIQKEIINPDDKEILEDLIISAVNKAIREVEKAYQEELQQRTKGMIPPGINIPGL